MKFTYWSGNKIQLENALREKESYIKDFANRLGIDTDKLKVTYNYKNQSNKAKKLRSIDKECNLDRASIIEHNNGVITIGLNDSIISKKIISKITAIPSLIDRQYDVAANIETDILLGYIANIAVNKSKVYLEMSNNLEEEPLEPLVPLFIASFIKVKYNIQNIQMVNDPYSYENHTMTESDWMDLFDICNYYRVSTNGSFDKAIVDKYPNRLNSQINKIIETLEGYLETYIKNGGTI